MMSYLKRWRKINRDIALADSDNEFVPQFTDSSAEESIHIQSNVSNSDLDGNYASTQESNVSNSNPIPNVNYESSDSEAGLPKDVDDLAANEPTFEQSLASFYVQYNLPREAGNKLLNIMRQQGYRLPADIRTLSRSRANSNRSRSRANSKRSRSRANSKRRSRANSKRSQSRANSKRSRGRANSKRRSRSRANSKRRSRSRANSRRRNRSRTNSNRSRSRANSKRRSRSRANSKRSRSRANNNRRSLSRANSNRRSRDTRHRSRDARHRSRDARHRSPTIRSQRQEAHDPNVFPWSTARYQKRMLYLMQDMRDSINHMRMGQQGLNDDELIDDFRVTPCQDFEGFSEIEESLTEKLYEKSLLASLKTVGGSNLKDNIRRVLQRVMTNKMMARMNMEGKSGKTAFGSSRLCKVVKDAVKHNNSNSTDRDILRAISIYLVNAPERTGGGGRPKIFRLLDTTADTSILD